MATTAVNANEHPGKGFCGVGCHVLLDMEDEDRPFAKVAMAETLKECIERCMGKKGLTGGLHGDSDLDCPVTLGRKCERL